MPSSAHQDSGFASQDSMTIDSRRRERRARLWRAAGAALPCLAAVMLAAGCKAEYPVFDPHAAQRPNREAASTYKNYQLPPLPTTLQSTGMINRTIGGLGRTQSGKPNVKIVVGHGSPKVGVSG